MNRRDAIAAAAGAAIATSLSSNSAEARPTKSTISQELAKCAIECSAAGEACLQHCMGMLKKNTAMAECADKVTQMLAVCQATVRLANANSPHLKSMAALCAAVCADCEKACRAHAKHHSACRQCADACAKTIAAAKKVA